MYEIYSKLLQEKGLTSYRVAKECGISQSSLSDWKRGKSKPKHDKMVRIAELFGVSVEYLETGVTPGKSIKKEPTQMDGLSEQDREAIELIYRLSPADKRRMVEFGKALLATEPEE